MSQIVQEIERLGATLLSADAPHRRAAAQTIGCLGSSARRLEQLLIERSIVDPEPTVRYALLSTLERIGWERSAAVPLLVPLLDHADEIAQARAGWALGRLREAAVASVPELVRVACDTRRIVDPRWSAVVALEMIGRAAAAAVPALASILHDDADPDMREAAARALGAIGSAGAETETLIAALADGDQLVRESAVEGIRGLGPSAVEAARPQLEQLLDDPWAAVREAARAALGASADEDADPDEQRAEVQRNLQPLLLGLQSDNERTRGISTFEIGKLGPEAKAAVPLLADLCGIDANLDVRWSAAWALGKMAHEAAPAAPALLRALVHDLDPDVRAQSAWALGRIAPHSTGWAPIVREALTRAVEDEDSLVREEAARALSGLQA
jgi:HEAT repeat protein